MCRIASASTGHRSRTNDECSTFLCLVIAPIDMLSGVSRIVSRSEMPLTSTRTFGFANRKFSNGSKLCPPARILPSRLLCCRTATASSRLRGATYSNEAGFNLNLFAREKRQHSIRREGDFVYLGLKIRERIGQGVGNRRRRSYGAALTQPLNSKRIER